MDTTTILNLFEYSTAIVAVVLASHIVKKLDREKRFKRWYLLIPTLWGIMIATVNHFVADVLFVETVMNAVIYVTVSTYAWKFGHSVIGGK